MKRGQDTQEVPSARRKGRARSGSGEDFLSPSFTFLRIKGISIGAHWSWILVFALVTWSLAGQIFPDSYPGLSDSAYLVMGTVAAVVFFVSVVLHELGHAFRALREGMEVGDISLWLFGGVARFKGMFPSAGAEFRIAIAGPLVSVVLAGVFAGLAYLSDAAGLPRQIIGVLSYLGRINAILVAFNMVPALPLDGGRVLRSWLWQRQDSYTAATLSAARAGRGFAYLLIGLGLLSFFTQAATGGIWFVFLGWFLLQAAQAEVSFALVRRAFSDVTVAELMTPSPVTVPSGLSIDEFFEEVRLKPHSTYPVVDDGSLVGLMSLRRAGEVGTTDRDTVRVRDVMLAADQTPVLEPGTPMMAGLEVLRSGPGRAVVAEYGKIIGLISVSDIAKALELQQARGLEVKPEARKAARPVWILVITLMLLVAAGLYRPPVAVISATRAVDLSRDITITGIDTDPLNGKYLLVAVSIHQPNALVAAYAFFAPDREVVPLASVIPKGDEKDFDRKQKNLFKESQQLAAAAAARAAGKPVQISGRGARVLGVLPGSPAAGSLETGDVITAIDGHPVQISSDLRDVTTQRPPGSTFKLEISRKGKRTTAEVASKRLQAGDESSVGIGVLVETRDLKVDLPFKVKFRQRNIGGPSAGLVYALTIADMIDPADYAKGRAVAASGTISLEGEVGEVGGLRQKAIGAQQTGARVFLVPGGELDEVGNSPMRVLGVDSLEQALKALSAA